MCCRGIPGPVVCVYDSSRFGAGLALDVLRTHPMVIIGGVLQVNPFFVPARRVPARAAGAEGAGRARS